MDQLLSLVCLILLVSFSTTYNAKQLMVAVIASAIINKVILISPSVCVCIINSDFSALRMCIMAHDDLSVEFPALYAGRQKKLAQP